MFGNFDSNKWKHEVQSYNSWANRDWTVLADHTTRLLYFESQLLGFKCISAPFRIVLNFFGLEVGSVKCNKRKFCWEIGDKMTLSLLSLCCELQMWPSLVTCGAGAPSHFPLFSLVHLLCHLFLLFPFFHWLYLFSSFVHPFPFYQNSPTLFPGRRS